MMSMPVAVNGDPTTGAGAAGPVGGVRENTDSLQGTTHPVVSKLVGAGAAYGKGTMRQLRE